MLKKILFNIIALIAYRTNEIVMAITLIVWILYTKNWLAHDSSPALFVIFFAVILYLPVFFVVFYLLMLIPKIICFIVIQIIRAKEKYKSYKYDNYSYADEDYADDQSQYDSSQEQQWQKSDYHYNQQSNSYSEHQQTGSNRAGDELQMALCFYGLTIPFTQDQLKEKRRKLIKTAHPDEGGDVETAADINRFFDILKKYAD